MPAVRLSLLTALLIALVHAALALTSGTIGAGVLRNLVWWQLAWALSGSVVAGLAWAMLHRRSRAAASAVAPALMVGLELAAAFVAANYHHTLGTPARLLLFTGGFALPGALFLAIGSRGWTLRWITPVQASLLVAALVLQFGLRTAEPEAGKRPDLALIVLDAVQLRALGQHGAPLNPSPRLDALAEAGWTADAAFSSAATSIPGHAAILFGLDVVEHRAPTNDFDLDDALPPPLAERLRERGYATMGFCQNPLVSRRAGFARGFDVWWNWGEHSWLSQPLPVALLHWPGAYLVTRARHADRVTLTARAALGSAKGPLFTFIQLLYTHQPYTDGDGWMNAQRLAEIRRLYDSGVLSNRTSHDPDEIAWLHTNYLASVAYSDRLVGEMIDLLTARAGARGLVVAVTADHGENLAEHTDDAVGKHFGPWSTSLRIPMIVHDSRVEIPGARAGALTSHQRLGRLFLDAADAHLPSDPTAWTQVVTARLELDPAFIYSEPWLVLVDDSLKVAINREDLAAPPLAHYWRRDFEDRHAVSGLPVVQQRWDELLRIHERMDEAGLFEPPASIDPEKLEHLRALGYIE